jgi:hypothetical protein
LSFPGQPHPARGLTFLCGMAPTPASLGVGANTLGWVCPGPLLRHPNQRSRTSPGLRLSLAACSWDRWSFDSSAVASAGMRFRTSATISLTGTAATQRCLPRTPGNETTTIGVPPTSVFAMPYWWHLPPTFYGQHRPLPVPRGVKASSVSAPPKRTRVVPEITQFSGHRVTEGSGANAGR